MNQQMVHSKEGDSIEGFDALIKYTNYCIIGKQKSPVSGLRARHLRPARRHFDCSFCLAMKRCPIAAKIAGSIGILLCCVFHMLRTIKADCQSGAFSKESSFYTVFYYIVAEMTGAKRGGGSRRLPHHSSSIALPPGGTFKGLNHRSSASPV